MMIVKYLPLLASFLVGTLIAGFAFAFALEGTQWNPKEIVQPTVYYFVDVCDGQILLR